MRAVRFPLGHFGALPHLSLPHLRQAQIDVAASLCAILAVCGLLGYGAALALRAIDLM